MSVKPIGRRKQEKKVMGGGGGGGEERGGEERRREERRGEENTRAHKNGFSYMLLFYVCRQNFIATEGTV